MKKKITVEFEYEHEMSQISMFDYIRRSFRPLLNITISDWKFGGIKDVVRKNPLSGPFFTREELLTIVEMVEEFSSFRGSTVKHRIYHDALFQRFFNCANIKEIDKRRFILRFMGENYCTLKEVGKIEGVGATAIRVSERRALRMLSFQANRLIREGIYL